MQIDKNMVDRILSLDDTELWQAIVLIAKEAGFDLSSQKISPKDIAKIRAMLGGASEKDIERAAKKLEAIRRVKGGEL